MLFGILFGVHSNGKKRWSEDLCQSVSHERVNQRDAQFAKCGEAGGITIKERECPPLVTCGIDDSVVVGGGDFFFFSAGRPHFHNKQNGGAHEMGLSSVVKGSKYGSL